jgi:hypothetical protein
MVPSSSRPFAASSIEKRSVHPQRDEANSFRANSTFGMAYYGTTKSPSIAGALHCTALRLSRHMSGGDEEKRARVEFKTNKTRLRK